MIANIILKQLFIPEYHIGVNHKWGSNANGKTSIFALSNEYLKKVVPERKQCFTSKWHISDIDLDKLLFKNPCQGKLSPAIPSQAPFQISRCYKRFQNLSKSISEICHLLEKHCFLLGKTFFTES